MFGGLDQEGEKKLLVELDSMLAQLSKVNNLGEGRIYFHYKRSFLAENTVPWGVSRKFLISHQHDPTRPFTLKMARESAFFVRRCRQRCVRLERLLAVRESRVFSRSHTAYWNVTWKGGGGQGQSSTLLYTEDLDTYLISSLEFTELLGKVGVVRVVELLLQTAVHQDMHHLSLLHVLQTQPN